MNELASRLALGTVQFGLPYGVSNSHGQIQEKEVRVILKTAKDCGITTLDTAHAYGQSEQVLGQCKEYVKDFLVVTKLPPGTRTAQAARKALSESLARLSLNKVDALLLHAFEDYRIAPDLIETLIQMKHEGLCGKIGFSLYYPDELKQLLLKEVPFDLVQFPYSILDRRFESYFKILQERHIEVHIRSIFLQGAVFINPMQLPTFLKGAQVQLQRMHLVAKEHGVDVSALCLNFVLSHSRKAKVVIGIDSLNHLKNNVNDLKEYEKVNQLNSALAEIAVEDENILLPFLWKK